MSTVDPVSPSELPEDDRVLPGLDPFEALPDLAARSVGGTVPWANDELFAPRDNLVADGPSVFTPATFGSRGQVYDGWQTRRRREAGHDEAIVRLGLPGIVRGIDVDTSHFVGNFPPEVEVDGCALPGYPGVAQVRAAPWRPLVPLGAVRGDTHNRFLVADEGLVTHVRLRIHPDGGVARLRVHGEPLPDPAVLRAGPFDLAATENGGRVTSSSNAFYSAASNLIAPGPARTMGEGWETSRRRDGGYDWVELRLAVSGVVRMLEVDARHFVGNAPGTVRILGRDTDTDEADPDEWFALLERTAVVPDVRHRFALLGTRPVRRLRLEVRPDGGLARLRAFGAPTEDGLAALLARWDAAWNETGEASP
ncbi:allantoicase [Patulibacter minatonensis]|uniref:allantoicase n=1 Tax=Patulibacter minatonensis TaxID=298163 RepID=UPI000A004C62|nr:allantoicase [Patulibacter minatonensis]